MRKWNDHPEPRQGLVYRARVEPNEIGYLVSLVEAHEGLAVVRTKDAALGIVEFWISPLMRRDFESLLEALKQELGIRADPPQTMDIQTLETAAGEVIRPAANRSSIDQP